MILRSIVCVHFMQANTNIVRGSRIVGGGGFPLKNSNFLNFTLPKICIPPGKLKNSLEPPHPHPRKKIMDPLMDKRLKAHLYYYTDKAFY